MKALKPVSEAPFPAPVYAETVLGPNFEDAKKYYLDSLLQVHYAHTRMLARQGILTAAEERTLLDALNALDRQAIARARYDGSCEDLFFYIERLVIQACGDDVAGFMECGRQITSRHGSPQAPWRGRRPAPASPPCSPLS